MNHIDKDSIVWDSDSTILASLMNIPTEEARERLTDLKKFIANRVTEGRAKSKDGETMDDESRQAQIDLICYIDSVTDSVVEACVMATIASGFLLRLQGERRKRELIALLIDALTGD